MHINRYSFIVLLISNMIWYFIITLLIIYATLPTNISINLINDNYESFGQQFDNHE